MDTEQELQENKFDQFKDDFALFIETGFIAVKQLDEVSATRLFEAAHYLNPSSSAPHIGLGYIAMNKLELKKAVGIFDAVLLQEPENLMAQTFLGICYLLSKTKRKKGEKIIKEAMEKTTDPTIIELGKTALEFSEKDLSKNKSPFFKSDLGDDEESEEKENNEENTEATDIKATDE